MNEVAATKPMDHAGIRLPPPLIYAAVYVVGWLLNEIVPLPLPAWPGVRALSLLLLAAGVALPAWSNVLFHRAGTSMVPVRPSAALVVRGPYRFTRNPMYLGLLCIYVGVALWAGQGWALLLTPLLVFVIQRFVIAREERYLAQRFGDAYRDYCAQVRRWL